MTSAASETTVIEIPGEVTLFRTVNIPPEQVALPLVAGPHIVGLLLMSGSFAVIGFPMLLAGLVGSLGQLASGELKQVAFAMVALSFLGVPGALFSGLAAMSLRDLLRGSPLLVIGADGFWDMRLRHAIVWSEVLRAQIVVLPTPDRSAS